MSKVLTMDELLAGSDISGLNTGEVVEGVVTAVKKNEVWIDLGARGVGVVMRREIGYGQELELGQTVTVSVIDPEAGRQGSRLGRVATGPRGQRNRRGDAL